MTPEHPSDPPSRSIDLPGGRVAAYTDEGPRGGPVVVAVHGLPGSVRDWRWIGPALEAELRFVRVDLPGFGETPLRDEDELDLRSRGTFLVDFVAALGLEKPVLMGHSMGGPASAAAVATSPETFGGLVLVASPGLRLHRGFRQIPRRLLRALHAGSLRRRLMRLPMRELYASAGFSKRYSDADRLHTTLAILRYDPTLHRRNVGGLRLPTAVFWTEDDPLVEAEISEELARACPDGPRLAFPSGGHNPQKASAIEMTETLVPWLRGLTAN